MNFIFSRQFSFLLGFTALTLVSSGLPAQAEKANSDNTNITASVQRPALALTPTSTVNPVDVDSAAVPLNPEGMLQLANLQPANPSLASESHPVKAAQDADQMVIGATPPALPANSSLSTQNRQLVPGRNFTSAASFAAQPLTSTLPQANAATPEGKQTAQVNVEPRLANRSGSSYVGIAGNIGFGGNSALGRGNFAIISKFAINEAYSVRPAAIVGDQTTFLLPVTYDFPVSQTDPYEPVTYAPYLGVGLAVHTSSAGTVGFLISGGADFPLSQDFTATAGLNASFRDRVDVGLLFGVGYNFQGF